MASHLRFDKPSSQLGDGHASTSISAPLLCVLLSLVAPIALHVLSRTEQGYAQWVLALLICGISGLRLSTLLARGEARLYLFVFYLYVYVFLGLAPIAQLSAGSFPALTPDVERTDVTAGLVVVLIGIFSFEIGLSLARRRKTSRFEISTRASIWSLANPGAIYLFIIGSCIFSLYFIALVGPATFFTTRGEVFYSIQEQVSNTATASLARGVAIGTLLVAFGTSAYLLRNHQSSSKLALVIALTATASLSLFMTNVYNSPRYIAVVVMAALASSLGLFANPRRVRIAYTVALAGLIFVFPALGGLRNSRELSSFTNELSSTFMSGDYDSLAQIINSITFSTESGHTYGRQLLGAILVWIPRSIWPDKPISTSSMVANFKGYEFTNLSSPTWAELFVDFGFAGVITGFLAMGYLFAKLDLRILRNLAAQIDIPISASLVPFYCIILFRGSLLSTIPVLLVIFCSLFIVFRRNSRSQVRK